MAKRENPQPVRSQGFKSRTQKASKEMICDLCELDIKISKQYARILWDDGVVEKMHLMCAVEELGDV